MKDTGVSNVIGAILVLAIVAAAFAAARVTVLPAMERDREIDRLAALEERLAMLAATARTASPEQGARPFSLPVPRVGEPLGDPGLPPTVSFEVSGPSLALSSPRMRIWSDGASRGTAQESWAPISGSPNVSNIAEIDDLRLKIISSLSQSNHGDAVILTVWNKTGAFAGDLQFKVSSLGSALSTELVVVVRDAARATLFDQGVHTMSSPIAPPYWVDVLTPSWRFARVVSDAEAPVSISLGTYNNPPASQSITADYAVRYREVAPDGTLVQSGGGLVHEPFSWLSSGGLLSVSVANARYPDQKLTVEHGALLLEQDEVSVFRVPPDLTVSTLSGTTVVSLDVARLAGPGLTATSTGAALATLSPSSLVRVDGRAAEATLIVGTRAPAAWTGFVHDAFGAAGLVSPRDYEVEAEPNGVRVIVRGTSPSPAAEDVYLSLREVRLDVAVVA